MRSTILKLREEGKIRELKRDPFAHFTVLRMQAKHFYASPLRCEWCWRSGQNGKGTYVYAVHHDCDNGWYRVSVSSPYCSFRCCQARGFK